MSSLREKAAVTGIGETKYSRNSGKSALALQLEASLRAIEDDLPEENATRPRPDGSYTNAGSRTSPRSCRCPLSKNRLRRSRTGAVAGHRSLSRTDYSEICGEVKNRVSVGKPNSRKARQLV